MIDKALDGLFFAHAMPEILTVLSALITSLCSHPDAAEKLLLPLVIRVGGLRMQAGFERQGSADLVLGAAMTGLEPRVLSRQDA